MEGRGQLDDAVARWLKRTVLVLMALFLALSCIFMWKATRIMTRLEASVSTVASVTSNVSERLDGLSGRIEDIEGLAAGAVASANALSLADPKAAAEIAYLLGRIGTPENQYEYEGKRRTAAWVRTKLQGKAWLLRDAIESAEDFIDKVAATTTEGDPYYVLLPGGEKRPLRDWLTEGLHQFRVSENPK